MPNVCSGECFFPNWIGDGYCDDENNFHECNYDGGDCCGDSVNITYCNECLCCEQNSDI